MALFGGPKKNVEKGIFKIYKGALECEGEEKSKIKELLHLEQKKLYVLMQFSQIARIWRGEIAPSNWFLVLAAVLVIYSFTVIPSKFWLLGLVILACGIGLGYYVIKYRKYVLILELSSSGSYSFTSPDKKWIIEGYDLLLKSINQREEDRTPLTYNITNGHVDNMVAGDNTKFVLKE